MHRRAAYHNKHWRRSSWDCQRRWPWMTLNSKNIGFSDFLAIFDCKRVNCDELDGDRPRLPANRYYYKLSRISRALAQISCSAFAIFSERDWTVQLSLYIHGADLCCSCRKTVTSWQCIYFLTFYYSFRLRSYGFFTWYK